MYAGCKGLFFRRVVLGDEDVEEEHDQEGDDERAAEKVAEQLRHELQDIGRGVDAEAQRQRDADDHAVAVVERLLVEQLDAGHRDGGKHRDRCAAEDRLRDGGHQAAELGEDARGQHDDADHREDAARHDLGGADEPDILAVGVGGQAADAGADHAADALALDGAAELGVGALTPEAAHGGGGDVADGLHGLHHVHEDHHDDGVGVEFKTEVERARQRKPGSRLQVRKADDVAHDERGRIADDNADEHAGGFEQTLAEEVAGQRDDEGEDGQEPELRRAEGTVVLRRRAAADVADGGLVQRKADAHDHCAADDGREEGAEFADEHADEDRDKARHKLRAEDGRNAVLLADDGEDGHVGEGHAHDVGQLHAEAEHREQLQQRGQAADDHGRLGQHDLFLRRQAAGVGDQHGRGDVADQHGQHMLHGLRESSAPGGFAFKLEQFGAGLRWIAHNKKCLTFR